MELETTLKILARDGYCLWVGSGVTKQLSSAGEELAYDWHELVARLEAVAGSSLPEFSTTIPERIQAIESKMGRVWFQKQLRELILERLAKSVVNAAERNLERFEIPDAVAQIARLGTMANQIVNFNIETWTSTILAGSSGPFIVKSFEPPMIGASGIGVTSGSAIPGRYSRSVLHPHGAIDTSGLCVLTQQAYDSMEGTLAFQLAVHAAFQDNLMIVGMSLEDEYLRKQLAHFRKQVRKVFWFVKEVPREEVKKWAWIQDVTIIQVKSWPDFWDQINHFFPPFDEVLLCQEWMNVIARAFFSKLPFISAVILAKQRLDQKDPPGSQWQRLFENRGEEESAPLQLSPEDQQRYNLVGSLYLERIRELEEQKAAK